jgi:hypothetical protein
MSFTNSSVSLFEPYHIYYDLNITNNDTNNNNANPFLEFNETRSNPILDNPSNYFVSVIRFSLETPSLPVFIPAPVIPSAQTPSPQGDPLFHLNYYITMGAYDGANWREFQIPLLWQPEDLNATKPSTAQVDAGDFDGPYFYGYSYTHFIYNVVNKALADCYIGLDLGFPGLNLTPGGQPFMTWESGADKATIYASNQYNQTEPNSRTAPLNVSGNYVRLYFNQALFNLFSSFESFKNKVSGDPTTAQAGLGKKDYIIKIYNQQNLNLGTPPFVGGGTAPAVALYNGSANVSPFTPYNVPATAVGTQVPAFSRVYLYMKQEYTTTPLWNPVSNITFTTSLLPVNPNLVSTPLIFNSGSAPQSQSNIANVLTDLEVPLLVGRDYKPNLLYVPASEYRLIDLNGNVPLSSIQIGVFWRDVYGHLHPFYLLAGNSATIKLMFRRKDFQTGQMNN